MKIVFLLRSRVVQNSLSMEKLEDPILKPKSKALLVTQKPEASELSQNLTHQLTLNLGADRQTLPILF